ncbi:LysE family translocator [Helicobacter salomonis]|uniref:LysE family translocator n=1 Tax=Helicobacter salomonis TaxID=56878 RepID=UPI001F3992B7|nr:LysE family transporter [Helicobacter salomonis]
MQALLELGVDILLVLSIHFVALLTPGPDFVLVSTYALKTDFQYTFRAVLGIVLGVFIWIILSIFGLKLFFETFPLMRTLITLLGACYLLYLAFLCLKSAAKPMVWSAQNSQNAFLSGFFTNILNPKAALYFGSIFSGLDFFYNNHLLVLAILALSVESLGFFTCIAILFSKPQMKGWYSKHHRYMDYGCAFIFALFACFIFVEFLTR